MRVLLSFSAVCCAAALCAAPACPIINLNGWQPLTASDTFTQGGLGLSTGESFSVVTRVTLPPTFAKWGAAFSLGDEKSHQLTLTFSGDQQRAYLSGGGTPNALGGKTWYVPQSGFDATRDGGKMFTVVLVNDKEADELSLWLNGQKQALSATKDGTAGAPPALGVAAEFPQIRLGNRIYSKNDETQNFKDAVYDSLGVFGYALSEDEILAAGNADVTGNAALLEVIKRAQGAVTVELAGETPWDSAWNGKTVVLSGAGTLALADDNASPAALCVADGTALTIATPMGVGVVAEALWLGEGVTLSARFTAPPKVSGTYTVLASATGEVPPLNGTVTYPTGDNVYCDETSALDGGAVTVAVIGQGTDGAYLLGTPADYEWYLAKCPEDATVRLTADITLEAKAYTARPTFGGTFDGDGHTLTLPEGASVSGTGSVGLIMGTVEKKNAHIRRLRVSLDGEVRGATFAGGLVGEIWAYENMSQSLTVENVCVNLMGTVSGVSGAGGLIGNVGGSWKKQALVKDCRVELGETATVTASKSATMRGAGGVLGTATEAAALENLLVVLRSGCRVSATAQGSGGVVGYPRSGMYAYENVAVADFGAKLGSAPQGYLANAKPTTLFRSETATIAAPSGIVPIGLETGTFPARDGATVALLSGSEEERLSLDSTTEEAAWTLTKADGLNTVTVTPTEATAQDLGATAPLAYAFRAMAELPEGLVWEDTVTAVCTPTMLNAEGYAELRDAADYEWYGSAARNPATNVCLVRDITLEAEKTYAMEGALGGIFDGKGHTLTLPEGATVYNPSAYVYTGMLASVLEGGATIRDVTLNVMGAITGDSTGAVAGTTRYGSGTATLTDVRLHLAPGATITGAKTGSGAFVGMYGGSYASVTFNGCMVLDSGATLDRKTYKLTSAVALYKGDTVTTDYAGGTVFGTYCLGEQEGIREDGVLTLTEAEGLTVAAGSAKAEGWTLQQTGNAVTVEAGPGGTCAMTYGFEGFEGVEIPVTFTPMALAALPEGVTATPAQKTLLMEAAAMASLPVPAKVELRTGAKASTLDALELFEGVLRADRESGALVVGYDFGISAITTVPGANGPELRVTAKAQNDLGEPVAFAEGAQVDLVRVSDGTSLLSAPVTPTAKASEVVCMLPMVGQTELFRAKVTAGTP